MMRARWQVNRNENGGVSLQIELGADYAVLLTSDPTDGRAVTLWRGSGEQEFIDWEVTWARRPSTPVERKSNPEVFAEWLDEAAMAHREAPHGGLPMADLRKIKSVTDAAITALGAVLETARRVGDDESELGIEIHKLGVSADGAFRELLMQLSAVQRSFAPREYSEWLQEMSQRHRQGLPTVDDFVEWLARRREGKKP